MSENPYEAPRKASKVRSHPAVWSVLRLAGFLAGAFCLLMSLFFAWTTFDIALGGIPNHRPTLMEVILVAAIALALALGSAGLFYFALRHRND